MNSVSAWFCCLLLQGQLGAVLAPDALTEGLQKLHLRTGGSVMVDMTAVPGLLPKESGEGDALWRELALLWGRTVVASSSSLLLCVADPVQKEQENRKFMAEWLRSLLPETLRLFREGRVTLSTLPLEAREAIGALLPPEYAPMLSASTKISFGREVVARYTASDGKRTMEHVRVGDVGVAPPDKVFPDSPRPSRPVPGEKAGELNFEKGIRTTVFELALKAGQAFGVRYLVDPRTKTQPIFVAGKWTRPSFEKAIEEMTRIFPVRSSVPEAETEPDMAKLIDPSSPDDPIRSLRTGKTTLGAILGAVPGGLRGGASLPPSTPADVTSRLGFYVRLSQPGSNIVYAMFIPL